MDQLEDKDTFTVIWKQVNKVKCITVSSMGHLARQLVPDPASSRLPSEKLKNSTDLRQSHGWPWPRLGSGSPESPAICAPGIC